MPQTDSTFGDLMRSAEKAARSSLHGEAVHLYREAEQLDDSQPVLYWMRAASLRDSGDYESAAADFLHAANMLQRADILAAWRGRSPAAWVRIQCLGNAAECLWKSERFAEAVPVVREAIHELERYRQRSSEQERQTTQESLAWLYGLSSECRRAAGDIDKAISDSQYAVQLAPEHAGHRVTRGLALQAASEHEDAIREFSVAIELDPSLRQVHAHRARSLEATGRYAEALADWRIYASANPSDYDVQFAQASALLKLESGVDEALTLLNQLTSHFPSRPEGWYLLGQTLQKLGRFDAAEAAFTRALDTEPGYSAARYHRALLRLYDLKKFAEAIQDLEQLPAGAEVVQPVGPQKGRIEYLLGEAHYGNRNFQCAAQHLERALSSEKDDAFRAEIYVRLAEVFEEMGDQEGFRENLKQFLHYKDAYITSGGDPRDVRWAEETVQGGNSAPRE
jgi:tetratricopeptide (TPR) repeat protein